MSNEQTNPVFSPSSEPYSDTSAEQDIPGICLDDDKPSDLKMVNRLFKAIRSGSLRGAVLAISSITFGAGCLAFPNAIAQVGVIPGILIFLFSVCISYWTLNILLSLGRKSFKMDYNELIEHYVGSKMVFVSDINNLVLCSGTIMSYQFMITRFVTSFVANFGYEFDDTSKAYLMAGIMVCVQIPLSLLNKIEYLQYACVAGTFAISTTIFVIAVESPFFILQNKNDDSYQISWVAPLSSNYLKSLCTFLYGFSSHNGIFQIFRELRKPTKRRSFKVLDLSILLESVLFLIIAFSGYFSTMNKTNDIFIDREDLDAFTPDYFMRGIKLLLCVTLSCSIALNYNIMRMSFETTIIGKKYPFKVDFLITVIVFVVTNCLTYFVKQIDDIFGVVTGIAVVHICFINPILMQVNAHDISGFKKYAYYLVATALFLTGLASAYFSIESIVKG